jgi:hypothetical protein
MFAISHEYGDIMSSSIPAGIGHCSDRTGRPIHFSDGIGRLIIGSAGRFRLF